MTVLVLEGESVASVARDYGISSSAVLHVVRRYCLKKNREAYCSIKEDVYVAPTVQELRELVDVFLCDCEETIGLQTPLWQIREIPRRTLHALEVEGLSTVEDLLNIELNLLKRAPNIGPKGMDIIVTFLKKLRVDGFRDSNFKNKN